MSSIVLLKYKSLNAMMSDLDNPSLVDIQSYRNRIKNKHELIYIFKSNRFPGKKVIVLYDNPINYFYYIHKDKISKPLADLNEVQLIPCNYDDASKIYTENYMFEKDFPLSSKHAYNFYEKYPDNTISDKLHIMFLDIELDSSKMNRMPSSKYPYAPIVMISFTDKDNNIITYSLQNRKIDTSKLKNTYLFKNEKELLLQFVKTLHNIAPDVLTAWNASFDFGYILNRMQQIKLDPSILSPIGHVDSDKNHFVYYAGYIILDMLTLYKSFTFGNKVSYKLDDIAYEELGEKKLEYEGSIVQLWNNDPTIMIEYNKQDVNLLIRLENKLNHIALQNELREFGGSDWRKSMSTIGIIDGVLVKYARKQNKVILSKLPVNYDREGGIRGAYVKQPIGGLKKWAIDLDYKSLYPSIIRTFNIGFDTLYGKIDEKIAFEYLYYNRLPNNMKITLQINTPNANTKLISKDEFLKLLDEYYLTINGMLYRKHKYGKSLYHIILSDLGSLRDKYKAKKDEDKIFDIKQLAMKVLSNSMYGAMINKWYRFVNSDIGETITSTGQEIIKLSAHVVNMFLHDNKLDWNKVKELVKNEYYRDDISTDLVFYCDTDSMFILLNDFVKNKKDPIKEIIDVWAPKCENIVNKEMMNYFIKERQLEECYLMVKQEWIAKTIYMTGTKKKYALYIINENKKPCDKVVFMGIETKRSDIPVFIRERLTQLFHFILKEEKNIAELIQYIDETEMTLLKKIEERDAILGKPVSFSKEENEYKGMPQHIKGMYAWNIIMGETFRPGTKGRLFQITGLIPTEKTDMNKLARLGKIKAIVIPIDMKKVPENFILDKHHIVETYWTNMVNRLLDPILNVNNMIMMETF